MNKLKLLHEGKAKKVFTTDDAEVLIVQYKDDATAFNGEKRGVIDGKGAINNRMSNHFMRLLEETGVPTHYIAELSERETAVKKVSIIPLEVIVRNIAAGSFSRRYGVSEGMRLKNPTLEFSYKNDALGDPMINGSHIVTLNLCSPEDLALIREYACQINDFLKCELSQHGITLVDFKLEFGKTPDGTVVLADEISPDTCRFWDSETGEKLDKDRFRNDLGGVAEAYQEVARRIMNS